VVQTVYEKLVRSLQYQRFEGACSLNTWTSSIAAHAAVDIIRRRVKERRFLRCAALETKPIAEYPAPCTERRLEERSELAKLSWAIARIKPEQANTIVLHDVEGYELSDVARLTGVSVTAAQSRLLRGRRNIQRKMGTTVARNQATN
jgi:RNA polymerase sigma-70 factor (ECF subfamily)